MTETEIAVTASEAWLPNSFDYHADREYIRHSALEVFRQSIPLYHGRYVARTLPEPKATGAMQFGTWCHDWFFGRGRDGFLCVPKVDKRTTAGKEAMEQHTRLAESKGLILVNAEDFALLEGMHRAAHQNEAADIMLRSSGITETPFQWQCPVTGIACKAKPDRFFPNAYKMADLKTADDPSPQAFQRALANNGYARQAAWYAEGARVAFGRSYIQFLFIVVGKEPPHETIVYELDPDALEAGRIQNANLLTELAHCREHDCWESRWGGDIQTIGLPRWAVWMLAGPM